MGDTVLLTELHTFHLNAYLKHFSTTESFSHFDISSTNVTSVDPQGSYAINKYEARQSSAYNTQISYIKQDLKT